MTPQKFGLNKVEYFKSILLFLNAFWVFASMLTVFYVVVPLFAGKFSIYPVAVYASWVAIALVLKDHLKRTQKGLRVRAWQYILLCILSILNLLFWFRHPIGVILSIVSIVGFFFLYRVQDGRNRTKGIS
jgi:hypothetical protein